MSALTLGSLFSGYGGLDLGVTMALKTLGIHTRTAWVSDIEPGPCKVLAARFPDAPNLGDITRVDWTQVEPVDILTGGFPCQDVSTAGRRAGMKDGTRSGLWAMMADAIQHLQPRMVVIENVPGLLSAHADSDVEPCPWCLGEHERYGAMRALGAVLADMATLGYDAQWTSIRASDVGACHRRERVFILACDTNRANSDQWWQSTTGEAQGRRTWPDTSGPDRAPLELLRTPAAAEAEGGPRDRNRPGATMRLSDQIREDIEDGRILLPTPQCHDSVGGKTPEQVVAMRERTGAGVSNLNETVTLLPSPVAQPSANTPEDHLRKKPGGKTVTDLAIIAENGLMQTGGQLLPTPRATDGTKGGPNQRGSSGDLMLPSATAQLIPTPSVADASGGHERRGGSRGGELLLKGMAKEGHLARFGPYAAAITRAEATIGRPVPDPTELGPKGNPRLSAAFVEWMMMLPEGHVTAVDGLSRVQQLRLLGNGVVPLQAAHAVLQLLDMARIEVAA